MDAGDATLTESPVPARPSSFGIGRRIALAFAVIAALLVALGALVSRQVGEMHTSVLRMLEEHREEGFARDLVQELSLLHDRLSQRADPGAEPPSGALDPLRAVVGEAERIVTELRGGGGPSDPSSSEHESKEQRIYAALDVALARLRAALSEGAGLAPIDAPPLASRLDASSRARDAASELRALMLSEGRASGRELRRRGKEMRNEVLWTTLASLGVLALVLWRVQRTVVRPVEALREGARRVASGDLAHRVAAGRRDEIGELAGEFNRMARELQGMREGLEERVQQRTREFLRAARLAGLGTMAAGVAHEINNPLGSIASCAEGLERRLANGGATLAEQREYLQIIAKEAYRAHEITSRLLEFARTEAPESVPFRLQEVMNEIRVLLEHELSARGLALEARCDAALAPMRGSPSECKQVLLNLIHNAIDASPAGGRIRVECGREGAEVVLEVEDQGPGIPPEDIERVFDPFFTTKPPGKGTGLGLAIVSRIVEGHGGRIEALNTGRGALFRVRMPLAAEEPA